MKRIIPLLLILLHYEVYAQQIRFEKLAIIQTQSYGKAFPSWKVEDRIFSIVNVETPVLYVHSLNQKKTEVRVKAPEFSRGAASWTFKEDLFLWGGTNHTGRSYSSTLWQYISEKNIWTEIKTFGPAARSNAIVWEDSTRVWLFGGEGIHPKTGEVQYFNDFWKYYKQENKWEELKTENKPTERSRGSAWVQHNTLWLYGGFYNGGLSDLWKFDGKQWQKVAENSQSSERRYLGEDKVSPWPGNKHDAHVWVGNGGLWLWGGNTYSSDTDHAFWLWNTETLRWKAIFPYPAAILPDDYAAVFLEDKSLLFIPNSDDDKFSIHTATIKTTKKL